MGWFLSQYLCLIRVNHRSSVSICGFSVEKETAQTHSMRKLMWKNGGKEQNGLRKYSVCAAARAANVHNYKHKPRIAGEPAFSISRFRDWKPFFFSRNKLLCVLSMYALFWHRCTQIHTDIFYICASSVCITVNLWFLAPPRGMSWTSSPCSWKAKKLSTRTKQGS